LFGYSRQRRILEHRRNIDEDRLAVLEQMVRETGEAAMESERKYEEVRNFQMPFYKKAFVVSQYQFALFSRSIVLASNASQLEIQLACPM